MSVITKISEISLYEKNFFELPNFKNSCQFSLSLLVYSMCMCIFSVCMSVEQTYRDQYRACYAQELQLHTVVICHLRAGN